ncbi:MAG: hypothetical protein A2663_03425 [Candidatus Buchananbacteria bacterium RIFCSPHIGHO2_01_FULL_46_12]|nr:MAG: hypothetical protein A2663_03425 [Candidatus Buchananbacteria bacterium RIFCSPHIGHO2_01_FULL_46_12]OGY55760.1 MAG: hypothetical protein A3H67_02580 [Candidatus Buchananbacteria bacterium RIFCSPLOWO2_02_FULL_46_11b]
MYDLTQLEQAGYQFTPLEKLVFENPSFQFLYQKGWPIKWGSLTTGLVAHIENDYYQREVISFKPIDRGKLTPHGAGTFSDEVSTHIRSVSILSAKVARDTTENELDLGLVQDFSLWLDGAKTYPYNPFRWIRFEHDHEYKLKQEASVAEVTALSQGFANVVVLLLNKLAQSQRQIVRDAIETDCVKRRIFGEGDVQLRYHYLPFPECMLCDGPAGRSVGRHCDDPSSIVLIDCGDVPTIVKGIPADVRRIIKPIRFKVPKSTFSDRFKPCVGSGFFPQLAVFSLGMLSEEERQRFKTELETSLQREQGEWAGSKHKLYGECRVIAPSGRQKLNALLLAGTIATWSTWSSLLKRNELWYKLLGEKKVRVDLIGG